MKDSFRNRFNIKKYPKKEISSQKIEDVLNELVSFELSKSCQMYFLKRKEFVDFSRQRMSQFVKDVLQGQQKYEY